MMRRLYLIHPFLFAIIPAVFLWGQNFGEVPLREVFPALIVLLVFGGLVWSFLWIFFHDLGKLAIISSVFLAITLHFNYIYSIFFDNSLIQLRFRWAFIVLFLVFVVVWYFVKKTTKNLSSLNKALTVTAGTVVLISLFQVTVGYYNAYTDVQQSNVDIVNDGETSTFRDIYYIILDGYSSPEVVSDVLGLEEIDQTVTYLEGKGFFVADNSQSNYPRTIWSIASSLNMRYLEDPSAQKRHFTLAENHKVKDVLKSHGYKFMHFGTDEFTYFNRYADKNINIGLLSPYQTVVWHNTIFRPILDLTGTRVDGLGERFGFLDNRRTQWEREKFKLQELVKVSDEEDSPIFAFAHFLIPKGPYVFDEDGNFLTEAESNERGNIKNYLGQVEYINKEIENIVKELLDGPGPEPIIIFQGDHGFPFQNNPDVIEDFADPVRAKELVILGEYSIPIFNAYYFPDEGDKLLYDSITPVNTFRILFNYYFGQDLELLEDISYTVDPDDSSKFIIWDKL